MISRNKICAGAEVRKKMSEVHFCWKKEAHTACESLFRFYNGAYQLSPLLLFNFATKRCVLHTGGYGTSKLPRKFSKRQAFILCLSSLASQRTPCSVLLHCVFGRAILPRPWVRLETDHYCRLPAVIADLVIVPRVVVRPHISCSSRLPTS